MSKHHVAGWSTSDRNRARPIIEASLPLPCIDCGQAVYPGQKWQVGHIIPKALGGGNEQSNLGPSHTKGRGQVACNQIAGGKLARQLQTGNKPKDQRKPPSW